MKNIQVPRGLLQAPPSAVRVYLLLSDLSENGSITIGRGNIAKELNLTRETVTRAIRYLAQNEILQVKNNKNNNIYSPNTYTL